MTSSEMKRLKNRDAPSNPERAAHLHVRLGSKKTILPMHSKKEHKKGLVQQIKKDLGLK